MKMFPSEFLFEELFPPEFFYLDQIPRSDVDVNDISCVIPEYDLTVIAHQETYTVVTL